MREIAKVQTLLIPTKERKLGRACDWSGSDAIEFRKVGDSFRIRSYGLLTARFGCG